MGSASAFIALSQAELDEWMREYNLTRTHSGKYCYGDSAHLAHEKMLDLLPLAAPET